VVSFGKSESVQVFCISELSLEIHFSREGVVGDLSALFVLFSFMASD